MVEVSGVTSSVVVAPLPADPGDFLVGWAPYLVVPPIIAAIAFVVPLYGMHDRLVAEKGRLQGSAEQRLKRLLAEINEAVDSGDMSRVDGLNKAFATMLQQREVLAKLPTWPWSAGTFRGFVTTILLPIAIFLVQRFLAQVL